MILYVTYNDQPSGVYWSQVTDVVEHLNSLGLEKVRLVAMVSIRGYFRSYRTIREHSPGAWVVPMVPRVHNWRINWLWLALITKLAHPQGIIARGIFATAMALRLRDKGYVRTVCFDGRGAYGVEWEEYRIIDDDDLIAQCQIMEAEAIQRSDFRLAVSEALVDHWRDRYGYDQHAHVVIPCTLGAEKERPALAGGEEFRNSIGWSADQMVLVYSGGTGGWQSLDLLAKVLDGVLASDPMACVLFLSGRDPYID
ncbi:MAG: glycosyltransferase, partial [Bacteroidota bacterium]|nr:glycosyltransferase [Bacteroidota bacterium]